MTEKNIQIKEDLFSKLNYNQLIFSICTLFSLLIIRIITVLLSINLEQILPLRELLAIIIILGYIIPILLVIFFFKNENNLLISIIFPFLIYAILYPLLDSALLSYLSLMVYPAYIIKFIIGGIGFALIGLGSYYLKYNRNISGILIFCGIMVIILSALNLIPITIYLITGDISILESIPNFL